MEKSNHRITYAFYMSDNWVYGESDKGLLAQKGISITPEEYEFLMKGKIFCPVCNTPLSRSPNVGAVSTNSRTAHFKHKPSYSKIPCRLKIKKKDGLFYKNEEEALKAIEDEELVIVSNWMSEPFRSDEIQENGEFSQTAIESLDGPETEVAIGRHNGREFKLPSKIYTVTVVCRNFDENLHRGYCFPNTKFPMLLSEMLFDVDSIKKSTDKNGRLFFGKIVKYRELDTRNIIQIEIKDFSKFKVYTNPEYDKQKHIDNSSVGRYILFYSTLEWEQNEKVPRCFVYSWGQYSLLPTKYEKYLIRYKKV